MQRSMSTKKMSRMMLVVRESSGVEGGGGVVGVLSLGEGNMRAWRRVIVFRENRKE